MDDCAIFWLWARGNRSPGSGGVRRLTRALRRPERPRTRASGGLAALRNVSGTASGRINRFWTHPRGRAASRLRCGRERSAMTPVDALAVTTPDASAALAARAEPQASVEMPTLGVAL